MSLIKQGGILPMIKVVENSNGDVEISKPVSGDLYNPIPKQHTRQYFRDDDTIVCVYDALLGVEYWSLANELAGDAGIISDVNTATDKIAVSTYLGAFIGKL